MLIILCQKIVETMELHSLTIVEIIDAKELEAN